MECEEFILSDWSPPNNRIQSEYAKPANSWIMEREEFILPDWSLPDDPARPCRLWPSDDDDGDGDDDDDEIECFGGLSSDLGKCISGAITANPRCSTSLLVDIVLIMMIMIVMIVMVMIVMMKNEDDKLSAFLLLP